MAVLLQGRTLQGVGAALPYTTPPTPRLAHLASCLPNPRASCALLLVEPVDCIFLHNLLAFGHRYHGLFHHLAALRNAPP